MADKKITQLNPAGVLTVNDLFMVCQDLVSGELLQAGLGDVRALVLGGANAGARIYFNAGAPAPVQGVDGDVAFDMTSKSIYQKDVGAWVLRDTYGAGDGGSSQIRFVATYGVGGLSGDGLTYTDADLQGGEVLSVKVDATELIRVQTFGTAPAFDEWDFNAVTGVVTFGSPLPAGFRISIIYSF